MITSPLIASDQAVMDEDGKSVSGYEGASLSDVSNGQGVRGQDTVFAQQRSR